MHIGIDLGTTNSAAASFDGKQALIVSNRHGEALTPSVVRVDKKGQFIVGRRAQRYFEKDPDNTKAEFKRLMGTEQKILFPASGSGFLPEELAAQVVGSLLDDVRDRLGFRPERAVISTPALFELPQNHATTRAGTLAGLKEVALIQEPVASAIAAGWDASTAQGYWMIFDLGGGTLDVSLLETKDGWLRVVDHAGDNFLGGKDFDDALVDWALNAIREDFDAQSLDRSNPEAQERLMSLKHACEQAKIDLSRSETAEICAELGDDDSGEPIELELTITRPEFEAMTSHLAARTLGVCETLIRKNNLTPDAVERVVFVGGPTLIPSIRQTIGDAYGGRTDASKDPMTLVAEGAALYAATLGLEAAPATPPEPGGVAIRLEYPAVTSDRSPFVVGRMVEKDSNQWPKMLIVTTMEGEPVTDVELSEKGQFSFQVELKPREQNRFRLQGVGDGGKPLAVVPGSFAVVHGLSVAEPPLSRSVGIARSDDTVQEYFKKGTPLPARRTFTHKTVATVTAGSSEEALAVPVVQGEFSRAHRNRLIGVLRVQGAQLRQDLPLGSRLEVTLELDQSGQLHARAEAAAIGQVFSDVVHVLVPTASLEVLEETLGSTIERVRDIRQRGFQAGSYEAFEAMSTAESRIREAESGMVAARGGNQDAAQRVLRLLLDLNGALDATDNELEWPALEEELETAIETSLAWVAELGSDAENKLHQRAMEAAERARSSKNAPELERQIKVLRSLTDAAFAKDPNAPIYVFEWYLAHMSEATDIRKAQALVDEGRAALESGQTDELRRLNRRLNDLFPGTAEERRKSYGSGVQ